MWSGGAENWTTHLQTERYQPTGPIMQFTDLSQKYVASSYTNKPHTGKKTDKEFVM